MVTPQVLARADLILLYFSAGTHICTGIFI